MNKYYIVKETRIVRGRKDVWYIVYKRLNTFETFLNIISFAQLEGYDPYCRKEEAIKACELKNKDLWDRPVSKEVIPVSQRK